MASLSEPLISNFQRVRQYNQAGLGVLIFYMNI